MTLDMPATAKLAILESQIEELQKQNAIFESMAVQMYANEKKPIKTDIFRHGYVELHDWMGDDLRIVNMARQSFGKTSVEMGEAEIGLINFLMKNKHGTPFEGPVFTFNVKCPIFVAREWFRHRISSYNEYSGRYSKMCEDVYIPEIEQIRTQKGKPGSYTFEAMDPAKAERIRLSMQIQARDAWDTYENLLKRGTAKEVARMVLPVNQYTQFTWVVNLRSLLNFISLRSAENAMWEIRQYSLAMEDQIKKVVPVSFEAFEKVGRVAP